MLFSSKFLVHINSTLHLLQLFNYVVYIVVFPDPLVGLHIFVVVVIIIVHIVEYHNLHNEENHQVLICCATL